MNEQTVVDDYSAIEVLRKIVAVICIFANFLVIFFIVKTKCFVQSEANKFMTAILSINLCVGVCFATRYLDHASRIPWVVYLAFSFFVALINLQLALSADRYWAVCHSISHLTHRTKQHTKWIILTCMVIGLLEGFGFPLYFCMTDKCQHSDKILRTFLKGVFALDVAAIGLMIYFNVSIIRFTSTKAEETKHIFCNQSKEATKARLDQQVQISITMCLIIGSFLVFWLPEILDTANLAFIPADPLRKVMYHNSFKDGNEKMLKHAFPSATFYLTICNSVLDPLIFAWRTTAIRTAIMNSVQRKEHPDNQQPESKISAPSSLPSIKNVECGEKM